MESTEADQLQRSNSISHYYSGHQYYNLQNEILEKNTKYGSFPAHNRKYYKNKLISKSASNLSQSSHDGETFDNIPFSQYTPNPYYSILPNHSISSNNIHFDAKDFYIDNKDDISSMGSNDESIASNLTDSSYIDTSRGIIMDKISEDTAENAHHPLLGMILVTLSAVCYAALNLSVAVLMDETPWQELMFIRMAITWIATLIWMLVQYRGKLELCGPKHQRLLLLLRAFFLWGAMFTCWWSFEFLPVGDGTTLAMSFPVWVSIFAHFVWKNESNIGDTQRLDLFGWICVLAGLLGIVFVAQPSFIFGAANGSDTSRRDVGIIIGIASAICAGAQYVIVNYTKKDCHWLQVEQITSAASTFVLCPLGAIAFALYYYHGRNAFIVPWSYLNATRWAEEIALGLLGFCALALLTRGSQLDAPARTAICLYLEIPFVYIGQCVMTSSFPDLYVFIGIFLVLCSVVIPAVRKLRTAKKEKQLKQTLQNRKDSDGERLPLLAGVTVDWSSDEISSGDTDIDEEYRAIL